MDKNTSTNWKVILYSSDLIGSTELKTQAPGSFLSRRDITGHHHGHGRSLWSGSQSWSLSEQKSWWNINKYSLVCWTQCRYRWRQNNGMVHVFSNNDRPRQLWSLSPFLTWPDRFLIDSPAGIFSIFTTLIWNGTNMERGGRGTNKKMECYSISDMSNKRLCTGHSHPMKYSDKMMKMRILDVWQLHWGCVLFVRNNVTFIVMQFVNGNILLCIHILPCFHSIIDLLMNTRSK